MKKMPILAAVLWCAAMRAAYAQNTPSVPTPQTRAAAPAGISVAAPAGQANGTSATRNASSRGSARHGRRGSTDTSTPGASAQGRPGITGVPAYDAGYAQQGNGPAPAATGRVVVTGDEDGNGVPDRAADSLDVAAPLPGVTLRHNAIGIAAGTPIQIRLQQPVDSGHATNGQTLQGSLAAPLGKLPAGAPVQLTVVAVAKAGEISSRGELSLQVITVNGEPALSEVITAEGKDGTTILPDDAPARGTEAIFTPDQTLTLPAA